MSQGMSQHHTHTHQPYAHGCALASGTLQWCYRHHCPLWIGPQTGAYDSLRETAYTHTALMGPHSDDEVLRQLEAADAGMDTRHVGHVQALLAASVSAAPLGGSKEELARSDRDVRQRRSLIELELGHRGHGRGAW